MAGQESFGGYEEARFENKVDIKLQCSVCLKVLTKPPRILTELLESLMIRCDYENRGCQYLVKLQFLDKHVRSCGYSPTRCANPDCAEVMSRYERERHERELCQRMRRTNNMEVKSSTPVLHAKRNGRFNEKTGRRTE